MKPTRFEMWVSRNREFEYLSGVRDWTGILIVLNAPSLRRRKYVRVRTFYDRHLRSRVVQVLVGDGLGVR